MKKELLLFFLFCFSFITAQQSVQNNNTVSLYIRINEKELNFSELQEFLNVYNATIENGIRLSEDQFSSLKEQALSVTGTDESVLRLKNIFRILIPDTNPTTVDEPKDKLTNQKGIIYCVKMETEPIAPPTDIPPTTPDYFSQQTYIQSNPGVNMQYAWDQNFTGAGISLFDVEYGMNVYHEEFNAVNISIASGMTVEPTLDESYTEHGTGALGVVYADNGNYGVTGMAYGLDTVILYPEYTVENGYNRAYAVTQAIANAAIGDIIMYEMQTGGIGAGPYNYVPAEYNDVIWDLTKAATDAGIIVVAAAGNGNQNLDASGYATYMNKGDSGAILVGAGTSNLNHERIYYSTYGSRVDVQAWAQNVISSGYGDYSTIGGDFNQRYTLFSGTSSATPIVASCAAVLQSYYHFYTGNYMTGQEIRNILITTGIAQGGTTAGHIGPIPDMQAAIAYLDSTLHNEAFTTDSLNIYPNPTSDFITITDSKGDFNQGQITIFNLLGQTVYQNNLESNTLKIDLSDLDSGAYFVKVTTSRKEYLTKIIKK
ncbi:hypothetical protein DI487_02435 [Flavobacterium sediminis]|uniref:Peptidase S8 n=1 Tax=Flavobacterium sediminis TaxID=2201181 RepID=A0A2U8QRR0_9FLAO|nr:S8/S53 family peptidase [Flavobacterium sediminis]AWM12838.1 hypothetical protein DI487_02435 [Flavobacterium sediminis]